MVAENGEKTCYRPGFNFVKKIKFHSDEIGEKWLMKIFYHSKIHPVTKCVIMTTKCLPRFVGEEESACNIGISPNVESKINVVK
jgi:hypothetical protein